MPANIPRFEITIQVRFRPVAQMAAAPVLRTGGRRFESDRAYQQGKHGRGVTSRVRLETRHQGMTVPVGR